MFRPRVVAFLVWILCSANAMSQDLETRCRGDRVSNIAEIKACAEAGHVPSQVTLGENLLSTGERDQGRQWLRRSDGVGRQFASCSPPGGRNGSAGLALPAAPWDGHREFTSMSPGGQWRSRRVPYPANR